MGADSRHRNRGRLSSETEKIPVRRRCRPSRPQRVFVAAHRWRTAEGADRIVEKTFVQVRRSQRGRGAHPFLKFVGRTLVLGSESIIERSSAVRCAFRLMTPTSLVIVADRGSLKAYQ